MIRIAALAFALAAPAAGQAPEQARRVTITRDDWGIAHIRGRTDADAVFGMIYAQAEDDFPRIEANYLTALGRTAEADGEKAIWADLRARLWNDPEQLKRGYARSPQWLRRLMDAWADGLNHWLAKNPGRARVLTRFEPWMALSFTEGSIGGDVERVPLSQLEAFYGRRDVAWTAAELGREEREPSGSNGIAIGPKLSANGRPLLLINPHTSFFFRAEQQVTSGEGLNAYGAATWGQFFIYQGFNEHAGWMHTSSGVDAVDEFAQTVVRRDGRLFYRYGREERPVETRAVTIRFRRSDGGVGERSFTTYRTHHGPITRAEGGRWIATALMHRPVAALEQSYLRTKAKNWRDFQRVSERRANSSNNTVFADSDGTVAFTLPHFVPRRDDRFDYTKPVDGADPATDWRGEHALVELPQIVNPRLGWIQNTNNHPWTAAGPDSPVQARYPKYMDTFGENPRGLHALALLQPAKAVTLPGLIGIAYDPYLTAFDRLLPPLLAAYDALPRSDARRARLAEPVERLRRWDRRWGLQSTETSLAIFWGEALGEAVAPTSPRTLRYDAMATAPADTQLAALEKAVARLRTDFGRVAVPWGEINRFQRLTGDLVQPFNDAAPSTPVPFTSAVWGSLASFGARRYPGTKRYYGTLGNSFVAAVEFGPRVQARAVSAGGQSGDPRSEHFNDQAGLYAAGNLRPVYFHPEDLTGHIERTYRPGE
ncbi:penicillin acylase family protein [Sphingomonas lenta]|uniref:Acylase n=1 Tax=Sphingomonas lenta TaxID=1141887 RepID=A0A2A2SEN5_9SPHN|nr:penicillin acylase family protein [Sphingomonas lenta]PAX07764.1 acylase [Sphingomonas lenta]